MPHQTEVTTSTPPQTQNSRTIPPNTQIATPPLPQTQNAEPTCSQKQNQLPSSRASHCEPSSNASPMSVPSRLFEIPTGDEEQVPNNDTSPFKNKDPPAGFYPSRVASKAITLTIKQQFIEPWMTWGVMTEEQKDIFCQRFKKKVSWKPEHEEKIKKIFHTKTSHRLSEMFKKARQINKKPDWMFYTLWQSLIAQWMAPEFKTKSIQAQKNRASEQGGSLQTGGSITHHEHAMRMSQELGRLSHVDELFHPTHVQKFTGDFVDQRSKRTYDQFETIFNQARYEAASCTGGSETSSMDPVQEERLRNKSWIIAADISSARATEDSDKIIQLEEQVRKSREEARQSREQNERLQR
ncbi:uncharacterized protein LOC109817932 [Cajanus cajan]|uniref:uncharacterized protein LOC109817932 n=1 Tax=Cajanus cajan TaxID=3821 RepID=UPI00098D9B7B|nr:uncharacterized protein LOC109817932 [Cajanus cajan]